MKTIKTLLTIGCTAILLTGTYASPLPQKQQIASIAKFNDAFTRFNVHRQQNGVMLTWSFTNPNNTVGFVIERSYDGAYFETVAEVPAINGRNQYKDNEVFPGYIYYRVGAMMYDGSIIYSNVDMVRIVRNG